VRAFQKDPTFFSLFLFCRGTSSSSSFLCCAFATVNILVRGCIHRSIHPSITVCPVAIKSSASHSSQHKVSFKSLSLSLSLFLLFPQPTLLHHHDHRLYCLPSFCHVGFCSTGIHQSHCCRHRFFIIIFFFFQYLPSCCQWCFFWPSSFIFHSRNFVDDGYDGDWHEDVYEFIPRRID